MLNALEYEDVSCLLILSAYQKYTLRNCVYRSKVNINDRIN